MPEGFINIQSPIVPNNDNPRGYATENKYIKGAPQVFSSLQELVAFHPNRMRAGMPATIINWPTAGTITDFRLNVDPTKLLDAVNESIITADNFQDFWVISTQTLSKLNRVFAFAPDGPGGGTPVYPYTSATESVWSNIRDDSKGHRWARFRDDDVDDDHDGIFDNWSLPVSIGSTFITGDYIENRFKRQAVDTTVHISSTGLLVDKYYIIQSGTITIDGPNLEDCEIGEYGATTIATLTSGRTFKYVAGNTYTFNSASAQEIVKAPPRSIGGIPNNEPSGWDDVIPSLPAGQQLWQITAQKSVYGQLKTDWVLKMIVEDPNFIRYSNVPSPHPDTIAGPNDNASTEPTNGLLTAAGWVTAYAGQYFIARREVDPGPNLYTSWIVEKISEESGEYQANVYKLFDLNLDQDSPEIAPPTQRDPSQEGWSDTPVQETETKINYVSQARKFFNGELKTPWSPPVPYTGADVFIDTIEPDLGDNFKYNADGVTVWPAQITLQANLFKGLSKLWENAALNITYEWKRVYNDGEPEDSLAGSSATDPFYTLPAAGLLRDGQRLVVKAEAVEGTAIFRVTQFLELSPGNVIEFEEEISLLDITDGKDAKSFDIKADNQRIIYNSTGGGSFVPANTVLRAYWANIVSPTLYWYRWNGSSWTALVTDSNYTISGNTLVAANSFLFAPNSNSEEVRFAVSTHATNPDSADFITTFSDYLTVAKLSGAGVGAPGQDSLSAIVSNEAHTIVLDSITGLPQTGQLDLAKTKVEVWLGLTKETYGVDYTVTLSSSSLPGTAPVTFAQAAAGTDFQVLVSAWGAFEVSALCTITIAIGPLTIVKQFSVSSTKDAPGTIILDLDSDKGFVFNASDRTDKNLTARLYVGDTTGTDAIPLPNASLFEFRFKTAGVWGSWGASNAKVISRSAVLVSGDISCEVRRTGEINAFASRTVKFTDVLDGKTYRAFSQAIVLPTVGNYLTNQNPTTAFGASPGYATGVTTGVNTWYLQPSSFWTTNPNTQGFEQEAEEYIDTDLTAKWRWSTPKQIKGEAGSQGPQGNFLYLMYKASIPADVNDPNDPAYTTAPALGAGGNVSTLAQMKSAGWVSKAPAVGVIWEASRQWIGQGVIFDSNGDPSTGPVSSSAPWNPPIRRSGGAGIKGGKGDVGNTGPGYNGTTYAGVDGSGGNIYNLNPVNGAAAAQIIAPKGAQGVPPPNSFTGWIRKANGGSATWSALTGRWVYIDTGDTTSKELAIVGYMDASGDVDYEMTLEGNSVASFSGGTLLMQRNYKTASAGSMARQYHIMLNIATSHRYIILKIANLNGTATCAYFGLTVTKV